MCRQIGRGGENMIGDCVCVCVCVYVHEAITLNIQGERRG